MPVSAACRSRWWSLRSPRRSAVSPPRLRGATASTSLATRSSWPTTSPASSRPSRSGPSITDGPLAPSRRARSLSALRGHDLQAAREAGAPPEIEERKGTEDQEEQDQDPHRAVVPLERG